MHGFRTSSGKELWYDMTTNKIRLWQQDMIRQANPSVCFSPPETILGEHLSHFTIEITQQCNLRCSYCCYSGEYRGRRKHNSKEIPFDVIDDTVAFILEHTKQSSNDVTVCFYGGEALLAKPKIQYIVDKLGASLGKRVQYSLSTNGLALTEPVTDWLCSYDNFLLSVTVDGDELMHDAHRRTVDGKGSFRTIIKNLTRFKEKYPEQYDRRVVFLSTVHSLNDVRYLSDVWDSIDVLRGKHPVHISMIIPNPSDTGRKYDTFDTKDAFYSDAFRDFQNGTDSIKASYFKRLISIIERRSFTPLQAKLGIITCFQDLFSCFINVDGGIYACEKFCDEYCIGNVVSGFDEGKLMTILHQFTERKNKHCQSCWAQRLCRICLTSLNHTDEEIEHMCEMERDTIELALKYHCEKVDWEQKTKDNAL